MKRELERKRETEEGRRSHEVITLPTQVRNWEAVGKEIMGQMEAGIGSHLTMYLAWGAPYIFINECNISTRFILRTMGEGIISNFDQKKSNLVNHLTRGHFCLKTDFSTRTMWRVKGILW